MAPLNLARHSLQTNASPEAVWRRWVDVATWPDWDRSLEGASLEGPFQAGTQGFLRLQDGRRMAFTITSVEPGRTFLLQCRLPGAVLSMDHRLEPSPHGSRLRREVRLSGWLAWLQARRLRTFLQENVPPALRTLARIAERPL